MIYTFILTCIDNNNRNADFGDSKLSHNPITNPINNVHYNKYLNLSKNISSQIKNTNNSVIINYNYDIQTNQSNINKNPQKQIMNNNSPVNIYYTQSRNPILQNDQYTYNNKKNINNNRYMNYSNTCPNNYNPQIIQNNTTSPYQTHPHQQHDATHSGKTLRQAASNFLN